MAKKEETLADFLKGAREPIQPNVLGDTKEPKLMLWEWMQQWSADGGIINSGEAICAQPEDQQILLNFTSPIGNGHLMYAKLQYTLPKLHYNGEKMDEKVMASPVFAEMYGRIIAKKREVEGQLKSGLASAAQAVADYELLKHDERKYREIMNYFQQGVKDEHVLRALFVDRIDAHTGEGYSMISMTKRWPTVITDFIRLSTVPKKERDNTKKIREILSIPEAEAVVLKTKNKVFEEWLKIFFPDIKERYARVVNLVQARRKSIDEYRTWLMPYVVNMRMIKEISETDPSYHFTRAFSPWIKPSGWYEITTWVWKAFSAEEVGKPGFIAGEIKPYDDFVKRYAKKLEKAYQIRIVEKYSDKKRIMEKENLTEDDILCVDEEMNRPVTGWCTPQFWEKSARLSRYLHYYVFYHIWMLNPIFKLEAGKDEIDDINWWIYPHVVSQNVVLLANIEIEARKKWLNKYVKELIGVREVEDKIRREVEKVYNLDPNADKKYKGIRGFYRKYDEKWRDAKEKAEWQWIDKIKPRLRNLLKYFMRVGPYETMRRERMTKMYGRYMGGSMTDPIIKFVKEQVGKLAVVPPP